MKTLWLADWEETGFEGMKIDFEIKGDEYDDINVIVGYYNYEDYEGDAMVIFEHKDKLFTVEGGHCSCYGLEGQWNPDEITIDYLNHRALNGLFAYNNDHNNEIKNHLKEYIINKKGGSEMSNIRKALENENVSEDKIQKVLKELGIKESKRWVPEIGEGYWVVSNDGEVCELVWEGDGYDLSLKLTGNMFKTEEEAQHHLYKINFLAQMKIDFEDNSDEIDWSNNDQTKYSARLDHFKNKIGVTWWGQNQLQGTLYTTNKDWLEQYIIDNERQIKKYCFGIE